MPRRPAAVARVLERVTATAREHEMFSPGDRVLVAVSGGPDSTCLLYALHMLRRLFRIHLEVFHFDHRLRPDSAKDAAYVKRIAGRLGVPFHRLEAVTWPRPGTSVELWARAERYPAAIRLMLDVGAQRVALGHTLDDQAETVLLFAIRGSGLPGIAGIRPSAGPLVRPLVDVRRNEVEAFVHALGLRPRLDTTNLDTGLMRNAIRLEGLPALQRAVGRDLAGPLARTARLLRQDEDELERQARRLFEALVEQGNGGGRLAVAGLAAAGPALASRVVGKALYAIGQPPSEETVSAVLDLAKGRPGRRRDLGGGLIAVRDREYIHVSRTSPGSEPNEQAGGVTDGSQARTARHRSRRVARRGDAS
jgi:tRNA(Ile)-lysidine synthase